LEKERSMTQEAVESIIGKVLLDEEFRKLLLSHPDKALAEFDLTEEEKAGLKSLDDETVDALLHTLDERTSKWYPRPITPSSPPR
jgi:hypothetical protein